MNYRIGILIAAIFVLVTNGLVSAQITENTLRTGAPVLDNTSTFEPNGQTIAIRASAPATANMPREVYDALYESQQDQAKQHQGQASNSRLIVDPQVDPAAHLAPKKNDLAPITRILNALPAHDESRTEDFQRLPRRTEIGTDLRRQIQQADQQPIPIQDSLRSDELSLEKSGAESTESVLNKKFDRTKFQALVKQLGINTGIVMCFGIGFILVAKKYLKGKAPRTKKATENTTIAIKSTLKIAPKSNLHLVEASGQRLIVAVDQTGIKSMVRLTESFASTLDSIEDLANEGLSGVDTESMSALLDSNHQKPTNSAKAYSLGAIGRQQPTPESTTAPIESRPTEETREEVRRKMEAALADHGLKDLILDTLRKS